MRRVDAGTTPVSLAVQNDGARSATTDADGHFRLPLPDAPRSFSLVVTAPGFATTEVRDLGVDAAADDHDVGVILLAPARTLRGRVEDDAGLPVSGVRVTASGWRRSVAAFEATHGPERTPLCTATTDAHGGFLFEHLPVVPLRVVAAARGFWPPDGEGEDAFTATPAPGVFRILRLERGWTVAGRAVDDAGRAAAGVTIEVAGTGSTTTTDPEGRFAFDSILPAQVELRVRSAFAVGTAEVTRAGGHEVLLRIARVGTISGRLVDEAGRGVPGRALRVRGRGQGTSSGEDGSFRLDRVPLGTVVLEWDHPDGGGDAKTFEVRPDIPTELGDLLVR